MCAKSCASVFRRRRLFPITSSSAGRIFRGGPLGSRDIRPLLNGCLPAAAQGRYSTNCVRPASTRGDRSLKEPSGARASLLAAWPRRCRAVRLLLTSHIPSVGLTRPVRPRFGMSNRRPSSLRSASIPRPQRPFAAFFPWALRAHSSRGKKASPWPPSTSCRPFGCGPIAFGQRQPSRSRWSRPENRKRIRTWLPSATSP